MAEFNTSRMVRQPAPWRERWRDWAESLPVTSRCAACGMEATSSRGVKRPVARFEDDHGRLGRPPAGKRVEPRINRDPALPQPITLLPRGTAGANRARKLVRQSNHGIRVRLEVEPPRGMALVKAVHRERDEVRAVFNVADDDAALLPGLPPDGREAQRTPTALVRRSPQESAAAESVEHAMNAPPRVHEPRRRVFRHPSR